MFKKLKSLGKGSGGKHKYRLDVSVRSLDGLPEGVAAVRVVWARQAKVQVTKVAAVSAGSVAWNEELSQIATLTKLSKGAFEPKEYQFRVQAPDRSNPQKFNTIGKAALDMARYADTPSGEAAVVHIPVPGGGAARLKIVIAAVSVLCCRSATTVLRGLRCLRWADGTAHWSKLELVLLLACRIRLKPCIELPALSIHTAQVEVKGVADDVSSVMSGVSGLSSHSPGPEQDLSGFGFAPQHSAPQVGSARLANGLGAQASAPAAAGRASTSSDQPSEPVAAGSTSSEATASARVTPQPSQLVELQAQNVRLAKEVAQLRTQLDGSAAEQLCGELDAAQLRISSLEAELGAARAAAAAAEGAAAGGAALASERSSDMAARLAAYEAKISQLAEAVEAGGGGEREAELEAALAAAQAELEEAEHMATEAMNMAEEAQAENEALKEEASRWSLQEHVQLLHEQAQALQEAKMDVDWKEKKAAKERADWEARTKDAFRRVEETVLLAERMQKERDELQRRLEAVQAERAALEARLDPSAVDQAVAAEAAAARAAAEAQARVEVEALHARVKQMEAFVEEADTARLEAEGRAAELSAALASARTGESDHAEEVRAAEERAEALSLELHYANSELGRLQRELASAREAGERRGADAAREAAAAAAAAVAAAAQNDVLRAQLREAVAAAGDARARAAGLEEALEAARLAELAGRALGSRPSSTSSVGGAADPALLVELEERRRAAEERATQLEAATAELARTRAEALELGAARDRSQRALAEAQAALSVREASCAELQATLADREAQAEALRRDVAAALAAKGAGGGGGAAGQDRAELQAALAARESSHAAEVSELNGQLEEARQLAEYSGGEMATLIQQLAEAQAEKGELTAKVAELHEEVGRMRGGSEGELRARIERLEREVIVARNRADVNALFKEEHDRIAQELVETKMLWAEAQEQIVKLKRSLVKSQEKTLESKLYKKAGKVGSSIAHTTQRVGKEMGTGLNRVGSQLGERMSKLRSSRDREAVLSPSPGSHIPSPSSSDAELDAHLEPEE
eukprot:scaffold9.g3226.t1